VEALTHQVDQLAVDHANALRLAAGLEKTAGIEIDCDRVQTNILFFRLNHPDIGAQAFLDILEEHGVRILRLDGGMFRAVVNRHITAESVDTTLKVFREILK